MLLIISADYVSAEFEAEIGKIPPCMLPIGNKKLIELQVHAIRQAMPDELIILALPESYTLKIDEQALIAELGIVLRPVPDSFNFANAVLYVLNIEADQSQQGIRILYGHTLIADLPTELDVIAVVTSDKQYDWHTEPTPTGDLAVWAGYFSFSTFTTLTKALALSKGKFVKAVQRYRKNTPLTVQQVQTWYNCGYINTFFSTRAKITTQRSFNSLRIAADTVTKTSENNQKIHAEANWYANLPAALKKFTPQLIEYGVLADGQTAFYCLEYLPLLPLNELFVHGRNPLAFWKNIFGLIENYLTTSLASKTFSEAEKHAIAVFSDKLYQEKTRKRLNQFLENTDFSLTQPIRYAGKPLGTLGQICDDCIARTLALPYVYSILHGDLCFSNILYDARGQRIKVIDPRGMDEHGTITQLGNQTYDVAKLTHSIIGLYDFIIAGRYHLQASKDDFEINFDLDDITLSIQAAFMTGHFHDHVNIQRLMPAVVLLFLSMLPLHSDRPDRQQAMLINAFRLYAEYVI